jgi:ABC-type amino acid transport substrate-binding protein
VPATSVAVFRRHLLLLRGRTRRSVGYSLALIILSILTSVVSSRTLASSPEVVTFGGDAIYPPFEFLHRQQAKGFNVDLANMMGELGGKRVTHVLGDWPHVMAEFEKGNVDVLPMFVSEERRERFAFTSPFYVVSHAIYAAAGTEPVYMVDKLAGRRVAMENRSYALQQFQDQQRDFL